MLWSAARKMTMSNPKLRQTPSAMIEPSAVEDSPSQLTASIPTLPSMTLISP